VSVRELVRRAFLADLIKGLRLAFSFQCPSAAYTYTEERRRTLHPSLLLVKPRATATDRRGASSFTECALQLCECLCEESRARSVTHG
jgi:hypothetical protein